MALRDKSGIFGWEYVVALFLGLMTLSGGISIPSNTLLAIQTSCSILVLIVAVWRLATQGFASGLGVMAAVLATAALALVLLQLVPLPVSVWSGFPGRDLVLRNSKITGMVAGTAPLTLSPEGTLGDGLALLPAIACCFAAMTLQMRRFVVPFFVIIALAIVSTGLALVQHFHGDEATYYLYDSGHGVGTGIFNNRNFFAAQLYTSLPILSAVAVAIAQSRAVRVFVVVGFAILYAGIIVVGLSLSQSRTGIVMALPAVMFAVLLFGFGYLGASRVRLSMAMIGLLMAAVLVMGQASVLGLLRLSTSDPLTDYRLTISKLSLGIAKQFWTVGSGFGTFPAVYQLHETTDVMGASYANHAHNDWLELVIEGGLPAILLLAGFLIWFSAGMWRAWVKDKAWTTGLYPRVASATMLMLMLHSFVDYPLRTPALMSLFGLCAGILAMAVGSTSKHSDKGDRKKRGREPRQSEAPKPFVQSQRGFRKPDIGPLQ